MTRKVAALRLKANTADFKAKKKRECRTLIFFVFQAPINSTYRNTKKPKIPPYYRIVLFLTVQPIETNMNVKNMNPLKTFF